MYFFFFFSSRRRHTRSYGDWSSDVCSSDLFRGFAKAAEGKAELSPAELAKALEEAANAAYRAVTKPTEGTILTVARAAGDEIGRASCRERGEMGGGGGALRREAEEVVGNAG